MNRYGEDWYSIRLRILERDNHTCRKCGKINSKEVHHLIPYNLTKNNSDTNLITLCKRCHKIMDLRMITIGITRFIKKAMLENIRLGKK